MPPRMESRTVLIFVASPYECGNKVRSSLRMKRAGLDESRLELKVGPSQLRRAFMMAGCARFARN